MRQKPQSFQAIIQKNVSLQYLLYTPKDDQGSEHKWPIVLFLHGMGERGADLELLKLHGIPKIIEGGMDFPFLVVSPQCPEDTIWANELDALHALLENIIKNYPIDTSRIYLTGLSMGGNGSWHLAAVYPDTDHDSWTRTYENPELYEWLLQQKNDNFHMSSKLL
jgi:predicted peptidase